MAPGTLCVSNVQQLVFDTVLTEEDTNISFGTCKTRTWIGKHEPLKPFLPPETTLDHLLLQLDGESFSMPYKELRGDFYKMSLRDSSSTADEHEGKTALFMVGGLLSTLKHRGEAIAGRRVVLYGSSRKQGELILKTYENVCGSCSKAIEGSGSFKPCSFCSLALLHDECGEKCGRCLSETAGNRNHDNAAVIGGRGQAEAASSTAAIHEINGNWAAAVDADADVADANDHTAAAAAAVNEIPAAHDCAAAEESLPHSLDLNDCAAEESLTHSFDLNCQGVSEQQVRQQMPEPGGDCGDGVVASRDTAMEDFGPGPQIGATGRIYTGLTQLPPSTFGNNAASCQAEPPSLPDVTKSLHRGQRALLEVQPLASGMHLSSIEMGKGLSQAMPSMCSSGEANHGLLHGDTTMSASLDGERLAMGASTEAPLKIGRETAASEQQDQPMDMHAASDLKGQPMDMHAASDQQDQHMDKRTVSDAMIETGDEAETEAAAAAAAVVEAAVAEALSQGISQHLQGLQTSIQGHGKDDPSGRKILLVSSVEARNDELLQGEALENGGEHEPSDAEGERMQGVGRQRKRRLPWEAVPTGIPSREDKGNSAGKRHNTRGGETPQGQQADEGKGSQEDGMAQLAAAAAACSPAVGRRRGRSASISPEPGSDSLLEKEHMLERGLPKKAAAAKVRIRRSSQPPRQVAAAGTSERANKAAGQSAERDDRSSSGLLHTQDTAPPTALSEALAAAVAHAITVEQAKAYAAVEKQPVDMDVRALDLSDPVEKGISGPAAGLSLAAAAAAHERYNTLSAAVAAAAAVVGNSGSVNHPHAPAGHVAASHLPSFSNLAAALQQSSLLKHSYTPLAALGANKHQQHSSVPYFNLSGGQRQVTTQNLQPQQQVSGGTSAAAASAGTSVLSQQQQQQQQLLPSGMFPPIPVLPEVFQMECTKLKLSNMMKKKQEDLDKSVQKLRAMAASLMERDAEITRLKAELEEQRGATAAVEQRALEQAAASIVAADARRELAEAEKTEVERKLVEERAAKVALEEEVQRRAVVEDMMKAQLAEQTNAVIAIEASVEARRREAAKKLTEEVEAKHKEALHTLEERLRVQEKANAMAEAAVQRATLQLQEKDKTKAILVEDMKKLEVLLTSQQKEWEAKERKQIVDSAAEVMALQQELDKAKQVVKEQSEQLVKLRQEKSMVEKELKEKNEVVQYLRHQMDFLNQTLDEAAGPAMSGLSGGLL
ncbi:hypothetical protein CEUSTIGMA_g12052.t1 [Chlamydomonas eustigma]|uniref:Uncharacterized protein n=1 Tax=Chlamydomonas eustigma TaxID=1157962 RepID=A0A250XNG7_9CHLO|nr:hypothetical protein CEUSTIGMA_g12052.t1 [Chlamydomonas eustigma]|eukprot:GAX84631.1 hypothetical protein CEUSTIGMA_g12052.t1 [Chlamydomonas eustigma]